MKSALDSLIEMDDENKFKQIHSSGTEKIDTSAILTEGPRR